MKIYVGAIAIILIGTGLQWGYVQTRVVPEIDRMEKAELKVSFDASEPESKKRLRGCKPTVRIGGCGKN